MPPIEAAANEKLASGVSSSLSEANVWQTRIFTPVSRQGNDNMHARYYSPNLGRFASVDPVGGSVGSSQSWNRYSYVLNSPLNFVDPDGNAGVVAWIVKLTKNGYNKVKALSTEKQVARAMRQGEDVVSVRKQKSIAGSRAASGGRTNPAVDKPHPNRETGSTEGRMPHSHDGARPELGSGKNQGKGSHNFWKGAGALLASLLPGGAVVEAVEVGIDVGVAGAEKLEGMALEGDVGEHLRQIEEVYEIIDIPLDTSSD